MDVKKVAYELNGSFDKIGASQVDKASSNPPNKLHKNFFFCLQFVKVYKDLGVYLDVKLG